MDYGYRDVPLPQLSWFSIIVHLRLKPNSEELTMASKIPAEMERNISNSPGSPPHLKLHNRSISVSHRQSFSDQLRGNPASPRAQRQPSLPHAAVQDLFDNPPAASAGDPAFLGRDWKEICVGELVNKDDVRAVDPLTGVEEATNVSFPNLDHLVQAVCRSAKSHLAR